jgi:hypothetical protein
MADYRASGRGRERAREANRRYAQSELGKETRRHWLPGYRVRRGEYVHPDVTALRQACKRLERALARAEDRA